MRLRVSHVGTGKHGFPLVRVEEIGEVTDIESSNPRELARELERQARTNGFDFEVVGTLPDAPDKPFPGWDPVGELLEQSKCRHDATPHIDAYGDAYCGDCSELLPAERFEPPALIEVQDGPDKCERCGAALDDNNACDACRVAGGGI